jgi:hypothetical protein
MADGAGGLPLVDPDFSEGATRTELAGDRHHNDIRLGLNIGEAADDHGRPLLRCRLIGERARHQHDVAKLERHGIHNAS